MTDEEEVTAQLLRLAGASPNPPADRTVRVRHAVHSEWRAVRRRRMIRRGRVAAIGLLGLAASLIIAVRMNHPHSEAAPPGDRVLATGQRIQGQPRILRQRQGPATPQPLTVSASVHADDVIETDEASRASLQTTDGSSVRIDRASRVRFLGPAAIELTAGAVYVATSDGSQGFEIRTGMGAVRDVGTRFEVRLTDSSLRLRVRAGTVEIRRGASVTAAAAGTEATVTTSGIAVRQVLAYGSEWAWTADLAPSFAIEGQPLRAFLERTAGEEGWTLRYADPEIAEATRHIILHGSVAGLQPEEAVGAALATSGLQYRFRAGELLVSKPADER